MLLFPSPLDLFQSVFPSSSPFPFQSLPLSLESLILHGCFDHFNFKKLTGRNLPTNLRHLEISYSEVTSKLSVLLCQRLSSLHTLILRGLQLDSQDLSSLALANAESRLPQLKHFNISNNQMKSSEVVNSLFDYSSTWNKLISLNILRTEFSQGELDKRVKSGCLSSLQELRISDYPYDVVNITWPAIQILGVDEPSEMLLANVADSVEQNRFPRLRYLCSEPQPEDKMYSFKAFHRLTEANISCHLFTGNNNFDVNSKCACQQHYENC